MNRNENQILAAKNIKQAKICGDILLCLACNKRGSNARLIIPDFQRTEGMKCDWCGAVIISKNGSNNGRSFKKIGRIEEGVIKYLNDNDKLVYFGKLTDEEKSAIGLTATGKQKQKRYY